jgi:general secretion pathway protein J
VTGCRARQAGFTLVELLVALALTALMSTAIFGGLRLGARAWASASRRSVDAADSGAAQEVLRRAISRAYPAFAYRDYADRRVTFAGGPDSLVFVGPLPEAIEENVLAWQRLHAIRDPDGLALSLAWRLDLPSSNPAAPVPESEARLLAHVRSLRFAYFGAVEPRAPPAWRDDWTDQTRLPELVRVTVERDDPRAAAWPDLVVEPKVTTNVACVYDPSALTCRRTQ